MRELAGLLDLGSVEQEGGNFAALQAELAAIPTEADIDIEVRTVPEVHAWQCMRLTLHLPKILSFFH